MHIKIKNNQIVGLVLFLFALLIMFSTNYQIKPPDESRLQIAKGEISYLNKYHGKYGINLIEFNLHDNPNTFTYSSAQGDIGTVFSALDTTLKKSSIEKNYTNFIQNIEIKESFNLENSGLQIQIKYAENDKSNRHKIYQLQIGDKKSESMTK